MRCIVFTLVNLAHSSILLTAEKLVLDMKILALLGCQVLIMSSLCCFRSSRRCFTMKVIPLQLSPVETYRKAYKENMQNRGQPTPSVVVREEDIKNNSCCITCGSRALGNSNPILQGVNAAEKHHPWQVYIQGRTLTCGGVLIAPQWILTAAHCISTISILLGETNLENRSPHAVNRTPILEIVHENYVSNLNDIALIKMNSSVVYNDYIRPICLPEQNVVFAECYVTGWGYTNFSAKTRATHLQQAPVRLMNRQECSIRWAIIPGKHIGRENLCTKLDVNLKDTGVCLGDSGGPLACRVGDTYFLAGITISAQSECHKTFLPDLFVAVSYYRKWIVQKIAENDPF